MGYVYDCTINTPLRLLDLRKGSYEREIDPMKLIDERFLPHTTTYSKKKSSLACWLSAHEALHNLHGYIAGNLFISLATILRPQDHISVFSCIKVARVEQEYDIMLSMFTPTPFLENETSVLLENLSCYNKKASNTTVNEKRVYLSTLCRDTIRKMRQKQTPGLPYK